jgi:hypothetical protein
LHQGDEFAGAVFAYIYFGGQITARSQRKVYGMTTPDWVALPLNAGTQRVMRDGMLVLFERGNLLSQPAQE